jgi:nucleolar pre-ribosomal-associated protein 1
LTVIGIQSFKLFLEGFSEDDKKKFRLPILREYLQAQIPRGEDEKTSVYLADIMQTWSFASQSNNESLLSSVPAVLSLLLRTLSCILDLSELGLRLCRTLLQKGQLELVSRGMVAYKTKDHVISPPLRLLREITIFDGGSLARQVFRERDYTLKALVRNLGLRYAGDGQEDRKKPSVRTNALRLFLTYMTFLPSGAKSELLGHRDVVAALTRDMKDDPAFLVVEMLEILKVHVLQDDKISRDVKSRFLGAAILGRFATLYNYKQEDDEASEDKKDIHSMVHEFLLMACTSPDIGILRRQSGFYPRSVDPNSGSILGDAQSHIDLGLDCIEWMEKFSDGVPVNNSTLSEFIQALRPWSNMKQSELLLAIFKVAPELVPDYFFGKKSFTFEPKLTSTWIGYSALIFSSIQLPIPHFFGHKDGYARLPPPSSIVIESILPKPLTQKALTRCLNQNSLLIKFFAIRLLIVAFQKLREVLSCYREASSMAPQIWDQAASRLTDEFCQRCPTMKDVTTTFRSIADTDLLQRQAASKLLVMYYEAVPQIALESKFDVSSTLAQALRSLEESPRGTEDTAMRVMDVENLFQIAHFSPGMRWFNKAESLSISPFIAMLKLSVEESSKVPLLRLRTILDSIVKESGILQSKTRYFAMDALVASLRALKGGASSDTVYEFIDNCALRCSTSPIKYMDTLDQHYGAVYGSIGASSKKHKEPVSLLLLVIAEQWPFTSKFSEQEKMDIATFIAKYFAASIKISENRKVIKSVIKTLVVDSEGSPAAKVFERSRKLIDSIDLPIVSTPKVARTAESPRSDGQSEAKAAAPILEVLEDNLDDHGALFKWTSKDVEEVIEEGHAAALVALLSSPTLSARMEALTNINKLALKLRDSSYAEKEQIWLLLSEAIETARPHIQQGPLPSPISVFVSQAIAVLQDPLHCLYPKINKFLSQGPGWEVDKIPLLHAILEEPPSVDDAHYSEVDWLLTYLLRSLRTAEDLAIFRRRHVFEKFMSLYGNAYLPNGKGIREKILRVLWRASGIDGGSTTLITRASVVGWVKAQIRVDTEHAVLLKALFERVLGTCERDRVEAWSQRGVGELLDELEDGM